MTKPKSDIVIVERGDEVFEIQEKLPLLPLRDVVIFPYMTTPLLVGRAQSVNAIERAVARDRILFCVAQRKPEVAEPGRDGLFKVGTIVRVLLCSAFPMGPCACWSKASPAPA